MEKQPENSDFLLYQQYLASKKFNRWLRLLIFLFAGAILLFIFFTWIKTDRDKGLEKQYKNELKALAKTVDSLKTDRIKLEENSKKIMSEITTIRAEKEEIYYRIEQYKNDLSIIKKRYEKINPYTNISVDSLHRIFSKRFNR